MCLATGLEETGIVIIYMFRVVVDSLTCAGLDRDKWRRRICELIWRMLLSFTGRSSCIGISKQLNRGCEDMYI